MSPGFYRQPGDPENVSFFTLDYNLLTYGHVHCYKLLHRAPLTNKPLHTILQYTNRPTDERIMFGVKIHKVVAANQTSSCLHSLVHVEIEVIEIIKVHNTEELIYQMMII